MIVTFTAVEPPNARPFCTRLEDDLGEPGQKAGELCREEHLALCLACVGRTAEPP